MIVSLGSGQGKWEGGRGKAGLKEGRKEGDHGVKWQQNIKKEHQREKFRRSMDR